MPLSSNLIPESIIKSLRHKGYVNHILLRSDEEPYNHISWKSMGEPCLWKSISYCMAPGYTFWFDYGHGHKFIVNDETGVLIENEMEERNDTPISSRK